ncbi:hypothetical protein [Streptomyces sp. NPDC059816]|uniref:hypothetical protein n=1 Tax=Streptomyces sp. NPDC059816 TaxID=3346960 RepID=UPI0036519BDA
MGEPNEVFTPSTLAEVFGLHADVLTDPRTGLPIVVPVSSASVPSGGRPHGAAGVVRARAARNA